MFYQSNRDRDHDHDPDPDRDRDHEHDRDRDPDHDSAHSLLFKMVIFIFEKPAMNGAI